MMGSFGLLALALTIAPVQDVTDFDRFQLFNNCERMSLEVVLAPSESADAIKLTKERLQFATESRLRSAQLFKSDGGFPVLAVEVDVGDQAFLTSLGYNKTLFDPASGKGGFATVWRESMLGTHGQNGAEFILSGLSELIDEFLTEYLRVNESACTGSPQPANPVELQRLWVRVSGPARRPGRPGEGKTPNQISHFFEPLCNHSRRIARDLDADLDDRRHFPRLLRGSFLGSILPHVCLPTSLCHWLRW